MTPRIELRRTDRRVPSPPIHFVDGEDWPRPYYRALLAVQDLQWCKPTVIYSRDGMVRLLQAIFGPMARVRS